MAMPPDFGLDYNSMGSNSPSSQFSAPPVAASLEDLPAPSPAAPAAASAMGANAMTGAGIGAGLGLLQSIGQQNAAKYRNLAAAAQTRYSPWTKLGLGQMQAQPNTLENVAGGALGGARLGQAWAGQPL